MRFALNTGVFRNESGGKLFEIGEITGWEEQDRYGNITKHRKTLHYVINNEGLIIEFDGYCLKKVRIRWKYSQLERLVQKKYKKQLCDCFWMFW